jgi:hypothetical protein
VASTPAHKRHHTTKHDRGFSISLPVLRRTPQCLVALTAMAATRDRIVKSR